MSRPSSRLTSGRSSTPLTTLKIAAFAPMPSARVKTTVIERPFARASERNANFRSFRNIENPLLLRVRFDVFHRKVLQRLARKSKIGGFSHRSIRIPLVDDSSLDEPH